MAPFIYSNLPHLDAAENLFFQNELRHILTESFDVKYAQLKGRLLVPTYGSVDPADELVEYRQYDMVGAAKAIGDAADDLPQANAKGTQFYQRMQAYGLAFSYTKDEISAARRMGRPLDRMRAQAVRDGLAQKLDNICYDGDSNYDLSGLSNITDGATETAVSKTGGGTSWAGTSATADEILKDLNAMVDKAFVGTKEVEQVKRILLPTAAFRFIETKARSSTSDLTVLEYFKRNNPGVEVMSWERLATSAIAYNPSLSNLRLLMSVEFEQEAPQLKNYLSVVNCRFKTGGVIAPYPKSIVYMADVWS